MNEAAVRVLTGTLLGNLERMTATSCFRFTATETKVISRNPYRLDTAAKCYHRMLYIGTASTAFVLWLYESWSVTEGRIHWDVREQRTEEKDLDARQMYHELQWSILRLFVDSFLTAFRYSQLSVRPSHHVSPKQRATEKKSDKLKKNLVLERQPR
jgi:hypothetical protein